MTAKTYTVQAGDTLGGIAERHATSVAQLRQLNPFIRSSDQIQVGWNLSLPADAKAATAPVASSADATAAAPATAPAAGAVLQLDPPAKPAPVSQESFDDDVGLSCNPRYADILYETGQRKFWLLRQQTLDAVWEAADLLGQKVVLDGTDTRLKGLDNSELLDYFLEPKLSNFLVGEEKTRLEEIETYDPDLEANAEEAQLFRDALNRMSAIDRLEQTPYEREQLAEGERLIRLRAEKRALEARARGVAQEQGYTLENGQLFSPEAMRAREIVQTYLSERDKMLAMDLPTFPADNIIELLAENDAKQQQALESCATDCFIRLDELLKWRREHEQQLSYSSYIQAILQAAEYGLALPEYALLSSGGGDIQNGVGKFKKYLGALRAQRIIEGQIEKKHNDWIIATGKEAPAPGGLCEAERVQWFELQKQLSDLEQQAKTNVAAMRPTRHLLWKPEEFQPRPLERLVRTDFPLREFSLAKAKQRLNHLSVRELFKLLGEDAATILKEDVRALPGKMLKASEGEGRSLDAQDEFAYWLQQQGAFSIDDQGAWFTEAGEFDAQRFKAYLDRQKIKVDSLQDPAALAQWGDYLKQMIFEDSARKRLRLFDHSPQARLIRCLTPPQSSIYFNASAKAPGIDSAPNFNASLNLTLDINLARGEVDIGEFEYPPRAEAINKPLVLSYYDYQNSIQQLNLGSFSLYAALKAWGFAGASLLLAGKLNFSPTLPGQRLSLDPSRPAERGAGGVDYGLASGKLELFAGVQAGLQFSGELSWAPPKALIELHAAPIPGQALDKGWCTLAGLGANFSGGAGAGLKGDFSLGLQNKQLVLRMKATVFAGPGVDGEFSFVVGYRAISWLLHLFSSELNKNQYRPMRWVTLEAFDYLYGLNAMAVAGINIQTLFLAGHDVVMRTYQAMTAGRRGGSVAFSIMRYEKPEQLRQWVINVIPEALGALLNTLLAEPQAFTITKTEVGNGGELKTDEEPFTEDQAYLFQQQAIEQLLRWIVSAAQQRNTLAAAQRQFEEAVTRMKTGKAKPANAGQVYCENLGRMNDFMAGQVATLKRGAGGVGASYEEHVRLLGAPMAGSCKPWSNSLHKGLRYDPSKPY